MLIYSSKRINDRFILFSKQISYDINILAGVGSYYPHPNITVLSNSGKIGISFPHPVGSSLSGGQRSEESGIGG